MPGRIEKDERTPGILPWTSPMGSSLFSHPSLVHLKENSVVQGYPLGRGYQVHRLWALSESMNFPGACALGRAPAERAVCSTRLHQSHPKLSTCISPGL